ncbi:hypothetical protein PSPL106493_18505 [Pseudomonas plecoglossicida]
MLEVIEQPFVLQQALDEIEVAFAVLGDVAVRLERFAQAEFVLGQRAETGEHFADDILYRFFLEDPRVEAAGQHPQPWPQHGGVAHIAAIAALGTEAVDVTVDVAVGTVGQFDFNGGRAADQGFQLYVALVAEQRQVELVELGQGFAAREVLEQKLVVGTLRQDIELEQAPVLGREHGKNVGQHKLLPVSCEHQRARTANSLPSQDAARMS